MSNSKESSPFFTVSPASTSTVPITMSVCSLNHYLVTMKFGVPFETCTSDCVGSTLTDVAIAVHAFYMAYRIFKSRPRFDGISFTLSSYVLVNAIWSLEGSLFWLQPRSRRLPPPFNVEHFDFMWKLNAQFEAILLFLFWKLALELLSSTDSLPSFLTQHKGKVRLD